ncbi:DUF6481 family protein [Novosphingobium sp. PS1R-30]|uniref:DUF6481 family protein n=1 Tax=Novosphingobium anseongense TaxID=3133436 RepID=A0ABU8S280_9SPHN|nr:MAG: hypothetical protein EOP17_00545 [Rhizobiaceae bacterium]
MQGYKEPGFQERAAAARQARNTALAGLRAKPPVDEAALMQSQARRLAKEAAAAEKRIAARASREQARLDKQESVRLAAEAAAAAQPKVLTEAERKAARDARYAARKSRKA